MSIYFFLCFQLYHSVSEVSLFSICLDCFSKSLKFGFLLEQFQELNLRLTDWGLAMVVLLARKFDRCTNFQLCRNVQSKPFSPAFGKPLLAVVFVFPFIDKFGKVIKHYVKIVIKFLFFQFVCNCIYCS
jgi:hypothetical protein